MEAKTFVQGQAQIITIVSLKKGDVYKRYEKPQYGEAKLYFGTVLDVMFNGEEAVIHAVEFDSEYSTATVKRRVFGNDTDLAIFPADPVEMDLALQEFEGLVDQAVERKRRELAATIQDLTAIQRARELDLVRPETVEAIVGGI